MAFPPDPVTIGSAKQPCPNCGTTDWTLRLGLGVRRPGDTRPPVDVCNVCSPAPPRRRRNNRWLLGFVGPLVLGLTSATFSLTHFTSIGVALITGATIGYFDPWDFKGKRR